MLRNWFVSLLDDQYGTNSHDLRQSSVLTITKEWRQGVMLPPKGALPARSSPPRKREPSQSKAGEREVRPYGVEERGCAFLFSCSGASGGSSGMVVRSAQWRMLRERKGHGQRRSRSSVRCSSALSIYSSKQAVKGLGETNAGT